MSGILNRFIPTPRYPLTTTAPYTYRDGMTFTQQIEVIRSILDELVASDIAQTTAYNAIVDSVNISITSTLEILEDLETSYSDKLAAMQQLLDGALLDLSNALDDVVGAVNDANAATESAQALATAFQTTVDNYVTEMQALRDNVALQISQQNDFVEENLASKVDVNSLLINVKDHGAVGDNVADDSNAIESAINAGGFGAQIYFPKGVYRVTRALTVLANQLIRGEVMTRRGRSSVGTSRDEGVRIVVDPNFSGTLFTCEGGVEFERLRIDGSSYSNSTVCISQTSGSSIKFSDVFIRQFAVGVYLKDAFYVDMHNLTIWESGLAVHLDHCYNVSMFNSRINMTRTDGTAGNCIRMQNASELHMFGGALEGYNTAINMDGAGMLVDLHGVYFETKVLDAYASGIFVNGRSNTVNVFGCVAWLLNHKAWVNIPSSGGNILNGQGNHFKWSGEVGSVGRYAYLWEMPNVAGLRVKLSGDNWENVVKHIGINYCSPVIPGSSRIEVPLNAFWDGRQDELVLSTQRTFNPTNNMWTIVGTNRNTALPVLQAEWAGAMLFDVDANKLVIWNGTIWVDSMGVPV